MHFLKDGFWVLASSSLRGFRMQSRENSKSKKGHKANFQQIYLNKETLPILMNCLSTLTKRTPELIPFRGSGMQSHHIAFKPVLSRLEVCLFSLTIFLQFLLAANEASSVMLLAAIQLFMPVYLTYCMCAYSQNRKSLSSK